MSTTSAPCVGSGFCCITARCALGAQLHGPGTDCPSLVWRDGRYWCGEVLREPAVGPRLDVGAGCCAPLFNDLRRAILASMTLDSESSSEAAKRVGGV